MGFWHEKLDVCRAGIEDVGRAYGDGETLKGHRNAEGRALLDLNVTVRTKVGGRGYPVREEPDKYRTDRNATDPDTESTPAPAERHLPPCQGRR
jgi:hypothetical protein